MSESTDFPPTARVRNARTGERGMVFVQEDDKYYVQVNAPLYADLLSTFAWWSADETVSATRLSDEVCISFGYYEGEGCESGQGHVCPRDLWEAYDDARSAMREAEDAIMKYPIRRAK